MTASDISVQRLNAKLRGAEPTGHFGPAAALAVVRGAEEGGASSARDVVDSLGWQRSVNMTVGGMGAVASWVGMLIDSQSPVPFLEEALRTLVAPSAAMMASDAVLAGAALGFIAQLLHGHRQGLSRQVVGAAVEEIAEESGTDRRIPEPGDTGARRGPGGPS